jgi:hypothetical protein
MMRVFVTVKKITRHPGKKPTNPLTGQWYYESQNKSPKSRIDQVVSPGVRNNPVKFECILLGSKPLKQ